MARQNRNAMNPLPTLIRASAWDAASARMRAAGRTKWNRADYNEAARTQERLVRACYERPGDGKDSPRCYIRFQIAQQMQEAGHFTLYSDFQSVIDAIEECLDVPMKAAA